MTEPSRVEEVLVFECLLDEPIEKVWRALTERELLAAWLMPNDFEPKRGHRFRFESAKPGEPAVHCQVLTIEPLSKLVLSWREERKQDAVPLTRVSFELAQQPVGTLLRVTHAGSAPQLERRFSPTSASALTTACASLAFRMAA